MLCCAVLCWIFLTNDLITDVLLTLSPYPDPEWRAIAPCVCCMARQEFDFEEDPDLPPKQRAEKQRMQLKKRLGG